MIFINLIKVMCAHNTVLAVAKHIMPYHVRLGKQMIKTYQEEEKRDCAITRGINDAFNKYDILNEQEHKMLFKLLESVEDYYCGRI